MLRALCFAVLFVIGGVLIGTPAIPVPTRRREPRAGRRLAGRAAIALACGMCCLLLSGWVLPSAVAAAAGYRVVGQWQTRRHHPVHELERLDALASWIENVRDVLTAGEQPIGAIMSSARACSPTIRPHVRRLAIGLAQQDPAVVFRRLADELDDPVGDLVAAGLAIAVSRGARTVPVLTALAEQTRHQVERRRLIDAERAPARREVQALTLIMSAMVAGLMIFGRSEYLDAYDTANGQAFLAIALAGYATLIVRVQSLARFPRPARFLTAEGSVHDGLLA